MEIAQITQINSHGGDTGQLQGVPGAGVNPQVGHIRTGCEFLHHEDRCSLPDGGAGFSRNRKAPVVCRHARRGGLVQPVAMDVYVQAGRAAGDRGGSGVVLHNLSSEFTEDPFHAGPDVGSHQQLGQRLAGEAFGDVGRGNLRPARVKCDGAAAQGGRGTVKALIVTKREGLAGEDGPVDPRHRRHHAVRARPIPAATALPRHTVSGCQTRRRYGRSKSPGGRGAAGVRRRRLRVLPAGLPRTQERGHRTGTAPLPEHAGYRDPPPRRQ